MAERPRRWLRPGVVVEVGARVWVVDEVQPVAVVLDAGSGDVVRTVGWSALPAPTTEEEDAGWVVLPAADGIWVQRACGPVLLVRSDGSVVGRRSGGRRLGVVTRHGAWCVPDRPLQDLAATEDAPPRDRGGYHRLSVAHPERTTVGVLVDAPVHDVRSEDGDLLLEVGTGRGTRRNLGTPDCWELLPETAWLRLPAAEPPPAQLSLTTHAAGPPTRTVTVAADPVLPNRPVDITDLCWPLPARPLDADDHAAYWRDRFADLDHHWTRSDGAVVPLTAGLSGSRADLVGDWPDTCLHITFDHARRPGQRLRRIVPVFDELGRPTFLDHTAIHLMEDLETGGLHRAVLGDDGHLDV